MQSGQQGQLSQRVQQALGLPPDAKFVSPFPFAGMNQQASRLAVGDPEAFWLENLIKTGDGCLRAVGDVGPAVYTVAGNDARSIISFATYNIGFSNFFVIFFDDGSAIQTDNFGNQTVISPPASAAFYRPGGPYPATVQWGSIYLLISNNNTPNDYWAWDGTVLYGAGGVAPQVTLTSGGAYDGTSIPGVSVFGGHGSGVVLVPTVKNGSVVALTVTNPGTGYVPGDNVQATFFGGNSDTGAQLQAFLQPTTVSMVVMLDGGHGYTTPPTVTFSGGGPTTDATGVANISGAGEVLSVTVTSPGADYSSSPSVTFSGGGGSGAKARALILPASISGVVVNNGGSNYIGLPRLTFAGGLGGGLTATPVMSGPGPIAAIRIDSGGSGYTSLPTVVITDGGSGTGATAEVTGAANGVITAITITSPGSGYTGPSVGFSGGGGSGAAATAFIGGGSIVSVDITNNGGLYYDAPLVVVQAGLNNAAQAFLSLMPFGVSGDSMETYSAQVWIQNPHQDPSAPPVGGVRTSSAPGSISDFATSDGGLQETSTDRFLRRRLTAIRQANGFLYPFGDSSVGVISNVSVQGNPATKTLTNLNTDPQTGTHWRDSLADFSRTILFANQFGIFGLFGGAVQKISAKMDRVFNSALNPGSENPAPVQPVTPSAAVHDFINRRCYLLLLNVLDPFTRGYRVAMVCWNEQDWAIVSQSIDLKFIGTQESNSVCGAWGTDGKQLVPLLNTPSTRIEKIYSTKLWGAAQPYVTKQERFLYIQAQNHADPARAPRFNPTADTEFASFPMAVPVPAFPPPGTPLPASATVPGPADSPLLLAPTGDIIGQSIGVTIRSTDPDFEINDLMLMSQDVVAIPQAG